MSDHIGRITVPTVINSGQTFPLTTQYPFGFSVERPVIVHRFGSLDAKQEQRYYVGIGPRKFQFKRPNLNWTEAQPAQGVLGVHAGTVEGLHLQRPQSRMARPRACWSPSSRRRSPSNTCATRPGRTEPHRGRRSDTGPHLRGQLHLPAVPLERAVHGAALRSPADHPAGAHPRARIRGRRYLPLRPSRHGGRPAIPAAPDRHRRAWLRRPDLAGHQRHLRQRPLHLRQWRPRDDAARQRHRPEVRRDRPLPVPRELRHSAATLEGRHPELHAATARRSSRSPAPTGSSRS